MKIKTILMLISFLIIFGILVGFNASSAQALPGADQPQVTSSSVTWRQVNNDGFGNSSTTGIFSLETFEGQLYAGAGNWNYGGQVWRTSNGTDWVAVSTPGFTSTLTNTNPVILDMIEFDGQLYAGTGWDEATGQIWRSSDGTDWELVIEDGFGNPNNWGITNFTTFSNTLYASADNTVDGFEVWRSLSGDNPDWTPVITGGLGHPHNRNVTGFALFDNHLYIAIEGTEPCQVWRTANGSDWDPITTDCFGNLNSFTTGGWAVLGDYLYIGISNLTTGTQLWRSDDGVNFDPVMQDGFGDVNNGKIEMLFTYEGNLLVGTNNLVTGMEVWRSSDGVNWSQINLDGFGDSNNFATLWSNAVKTFHNQLYIGTMNGATGGEVWRLIDKVAYLPIIKR